MVWIDDGIGIGDYVDVIVVVVEGQVQVGVFGFDFGDQVFQVFWFVWVWMVVWEVVVDFVVQWDYVVVQGFD